MKIEFQLHDKQALALESPADMLLYGGAAGGGKLLPLSEIVPTPSGWKEIGQLKQGDVLFSETGSQITVTHLHPIEQRPESYRLTFDNGHQIVCCKDHLWHTYTASELAALTRRSDKWREKRRRTRLSRKRGLKSEKFSNTITERNKNKPPATKQPPNGSVRTTGEIYETLKTTSGRTNHAIPVAKPLELPDAKLLVPPYVLGAWLGDGSTGCGGFTGIDAEIWQEIEREGFQVTHSATKESRHYIIGLAPLLKQIGIDKNKHIPKQYLRASRQQRLALLQGLLDTDGTVSHGGGAEFCNTNKSIVDGVHELIVSLGWKCAVKEGRARLHGKDKGKKWTIKFTPSEYVFRLPRKIAKQRLATRRTTKFHYIVDCQPCAPVPMRCITVSNPTGLFLVSSSMIPTHNSHSARVFAILAALEVPGLPIYFLRRHFSDLKKNHFIGNTSFPALLGPLIAKKKVEIADLEIRFANGPEPSKPFDGGSRIIGVQCNHDKDLDKIQGAEIGLLVAEESTQILQRHLEYYLGRIRVNSTLKQRIKETAWAGKLPGAMFFTNPTGRSLGWHKSQWIDGKEPYRVYKVEKTVTDDKGNPIPVVNRFQFIPASLDDNPDIDKAEYIASLSHLSPDLQKALIQGLWDVRFGNFFPELSAVTHVRPHFTPPPHWPRFITHDWGSNAPAATIWWAVADGEVGDMPRGSLYAYREWYVVDPQDNTKGQGLSNIELAKGIAERTDAPNLVCWTDSIPFQDRGHDKPMFVEYEEHGVHLKPAQMANKARSASMVRSRLVGEHGTPYLYFSDQCPHTFRTLAELGHHSLDRDKPDGEEDHLPDCVMHACRMWTHAADSQETEADRINAELEKMRVVKLTDLAPDISSILNGN